MDYIKEMRTLVGPRPMLLPGTLVVVTDEQRRILLIHRADTGEWALPGGYMEPGETFLDTGVREVREETGLSVFDPRMLGVWSGPDYFFEYPNGDQVFKVTAVYVARSAGGLLRPDPAEALDARFFDPFALPENLFDQERAFIEAYLANTAAESAASAVPAVPPVPAVSAVSPVPVAAAMSR
ncbi:NUDIX hydrolase [Streptomyces sp. LHD-70]|uniref:NUDIX hydrolase n=1 Tax=Streptomyces sp. LHD-70 TaxID=3072140 RepID=UPI0028106BF7|nr:NUDIX hydrolase [Streptomyces sp. LHD-70]MDQ8706962.1 NUDIX hydrolase [Streptomyces sp. LHD-70]